MFVDALQASLKLTPKSGSPFTIPGGNVKHIKVQVYSYGFSCRVSFLVSSEKETDNVYSSFTTMDIMEANLQLTPCLLPEGTQVDPLSLSGIVTLKEILQERTVEHAPLSGNPVLYRLYQVTFSDPAQVLWRQHYPFDLLVNKSLKDVIEAHKGDKITPTYNWSVLETQNVINTVPLGVEASNGSFYDFIMWIVDSQNGVLTYDTKANGYTFSTSKSAEGQAASLDRQDISEYRVVFPETIRYNVDVLNAYSESPEKKTLTNDQAATVMTHAYMDRYPVAADYQNRQTLETARIKKRSHEVHLVFARFPTLTFNTGTLVKLEGGLWSASIFPHGQTYRVREITIDAEPADPELTTDHNLTASRYKMNVEAQLETQAETWVSLPAFQRPSFPIYVEGKILSEQGDDQAETYQIYQDANTSQNQYKVKIPLWGDDAQVVTSLEPIFVSGHFYFPAYKNERVLLALGFHSASIVRFLDWRADAQVTMDSQGNKLLMGQSSTSQTYLSHTYVDSKPVLTVKRTNDKDTETITISEGSLLLQTQEQSS